jgi:hypothetical protein
MPVFLDYDDGPLLEGARTARQDGREALEHMRRASVVEAEDYHARFPIMRERRNLAEVESKVRMIRLSKIAFVKISPFGKRWRPWSRR